MPTNLDDLHDDLAHRGAEGDELAAKLHQLVCEYRHLSEEKMRILVEMEQRIRIFSSARIVLEAGLRRDRVIA